MGLRAGEDKVRELAQVLKRLDTVSNVAEVMVQLELPEADIDEVRHSLDSKLIYREIS